MQLAWTVGNFSAKRADCAARIKGMRRGRRNLGKHPRATISGREFGQRMKFPTGRPRSPAPAALTRMAPSPRPARWRAGGIASGHDRSRMELHELRIGNDGAGAMRR